jgi:hypothetical protein
MLKYACLDDSLAGSFAKLLAPLIKYRACPCVTFYYIIFTCRWNDDGWKLAGDGHKYKGDCCYMDQVGETYTWIKWVKQIIQLWYDNRHLSGPLAFVCSIQAV